MLAGDEPAGGWSWWDPTALPQLWAGGLDARGWHDAGVMAQCRGNGNAARGQKQQVKGAG